MTEYPDLPTGVDEHGLPPDLPPDFGQAARPLSRGDLWRAQELSYQDAYPASAQPSYSVYAVESRPLRSPVWEMRPRGEFRGGRSYRAHPQLVRYVPGLFLYGALIFSGPEVAINCAYQMRSLNPGHDFRAVRIRIICRVEAMVSGRTDQLVSALARQAQSHPHSEAARTAAAAAAELAALSAQVEGLRAQLGEGRLLAQSERVEVLESTAA